MGPSWLHVAVLALLAGPAGGGVGAALLATLLPEGRAPRVNANACGPTEQPPPPSDSAATATAGAIEARATFQEGLGSRGTSTAWQLPGAVASVRGRSFCGTEGCRKRSTFMAEGNGSVAMRFFCAEHRSADASPKARPFNNPLPTYQPLDCLEAKKRTRRIRSHPGVELRANLKSISHRCHRSSKWHVYGS